MTIRLAAECRWDILSLGEVMLRFDPGEGRVRLWEGGGEYNASHSALAMTTSGDTSMASRDRSGEADGRRQRTGGSMVRPAVISSAYSRKGP